MAAKYAFAAWHYAALAVFMLASWGYGRVVAGRILEQASVDRWLRGGLAMVAGSGVAICLLQALGIAGSLNTVGVLVVIGTGLACAGWSMVSGGRSVWHWPHWSSWLVLAFATSTLLYPLRVPLAWDELAYHLPHARQWALSGRLDVNDWLRYPWFPYNYNLLYAAAMVVYDDVMAHMLHAYAGWLTAFLLHRWALPLVGRAAACGAAMLWLQSTRAEFATAYIDMGVTLFVCAAFAVLQLWRERPQARAALALAAFLFGVALGSKYQALTFLPLFALGVLTRDRRWHSGVLCVLAAAVPCIYWYARNLVMTGDPVSPLGGTVFGFTDWNLGDYRHQFYDIARNYGWPPAHVAVACAAPWLAWRHPQRRTLWACIGFAGYAVVVWLLTSHYSRYLMPAYPVLFMLVTGVFAHAVGWAAASWSRRWPTWRGRARLGRRVQGMAIALMLLLVTGRYYNRNGYEWSHVAVDPAERRAVVRTWLADYAGAIDYLQAHPVRKIYQSGMEGVLYYLPFPVWGDHFGPWRYRDFLALAPERLAERLREQGFDLIVVRRPDFPSAEMPAFGRYFDTVYEDPMFRIFTLTAVPP